jgi:hypothetical protein
VKDNFKSDKSHEYKQIWQGHYTPELGPNLIRSSFPDATGCDILQLNKADTSYVSGSRGKNWTVISKLDQRDFNFLTIIFPYRGYAKRIDETSNLLNIDGWVVNDEKWKIKGSKPTVINKLEEFYCFGISEIKLNDFTILTSRETDLYLKIEGNSLKVSQLGDSEISLTVNYGKSNKSVTIVLKPGENHLFNLD